MSHLFQLFLLFLCGLMLAAPCAVLYGCRWWCQYRPRRDWRTQVLRIGVSYAILLSVGICVFIAATPHSPPLAHFPYVYRWTPVIARASAACLLFALLAWGRLSLAFAVVGLGGIAFAFVRQLIL